ncbi:hypothetical protein [Hungatella hathewayi]
MKLQNQAEIVFGAISVYAPQEINQHFRRQWIEAIVKGLEEVKKKEAREGATFRTSK